MGTPGERGIIESNYISTSMLVNSMSSMESNRHSIGGMARNALSLPVPEVWDVPLVGNPE